METQMRHLPEEGRLLEEVVHGEELIDYNFLRNVWGSYSCEGEGVDSEDKLDHINKIVGIIKTHVKMMVLSEGKHHKAVEDPFAVTQSEPYQALKAELDQARQQLAEGQLREQELRAKMGQRDEQVRLLEEESESLRGQLQELRAAKNRANEQVIELSSRCFQLQRVERGCESSLGQFSAVSEQRGQRDQPCVSVFGRKDSLLFQCESVCSEEGEGEALREITLNVPARHPLKQSLQCHFREDSDGQFLEEMKRIKLRTERIIAESFGSYPQRASLRRKTQVVREAEGREKRFKRIR